MPTMAKTTIPLTIASPEVKERAETERPSSKWFRLSNLTSSCFVVDLKQRINTWRLKLLSSKGSWTKRKAEDQCHHIQHTQPPEDTQSHCQAKLFRHFSYQELNSITAASNSLLSETSAVHCKTKLQQFYSPNTATKTFQKNSTSQFSTAKNVEGKKGPRYGRKVKIAARLLSLDLIHSDDEVISCLLKDEYTGITRSTSLDSGCFSIVSTSLASVHSESGEEFFKNLKSSTFEEVNGTSSPINTTNTNTNSSTATTSVDKMTIWDISYSEVRKEYPDLNAEIRSILTARAQEGSTITDIREDYHNLTGVVFPVYENITDFLLSIPYVSAYCNEDGIRIFNIRPTEKTQHIYDMVVLQKNPQDTLHKFYKGNNRTYYRERQKNTNYNPTNWRNNSIYRHQKANEVNYYRQTPQPLLPQVVDKELSLSVQEVEEQETLKSKEVYCNDGQPQEQQQQQPCTIVCNDRNVILRDTDDYIEHCCCINGNCKYDHNNMCSAQNGLDPKSDNCIPLEIIAPPIVHSWKEQEQQHYPEQRQQQHHRQILNIDSLLPTVEELNNLNANPPTCYDQNINHLNNIFYKANPNNVLRRSRNSENGPPPLYKSRSPTVRSYSTNDSIFTDSDYEAHLLDFLLLGDDFLLYMARMELKCKFRKNQRILQSGLCVSGQTIDAAIRRILNVNISGRSVIVNIGSVNILQGRQLIQIEHEYRELIKIMIKRGIKPILTTLAPLANYTHNIELKTTLQRFNEFIKREGKRLDLIVIDIWKCLMSAKGNVLFDCYQHEPRLVTGAKEPYLFWNKIGRQRVLQLIESHLEY